MDIVASYRMVGCGGYTRKHIYAQTNGQTNDRPLMTQYHSGMCLCNVTITMTSWWARWRLQSPASRLCTQPFIQVQNQESIKAPRHWPLCGEFTGDRWIPRTKGQQRGKWFHLMTSSWPKYGMWRKRPSLEFLHWCPIIESSHCSLFEYWVSVYMIYEYLDFKWDALTLPGWQQCMN